MARVAFKVAVSAALIWWLLSGMELSEITEPLARLNPLGLAFGVGLILLATLIGAWRWQLIIRAWGGSLGIWTLWSHVLVGVFFNQALPSSIGGDAVRIWRVSRAGLSLKLAASSVIVDRATGAAGLLILVALGQLLSMGKNTDPALNVILPALIGAGTAAIIAAALFDKVPLPIGMRRWRWLAALGGLSRDFRSVIMVPRLAFMLLLSATLMQTAVALSVYAISMSLKISVGWLDHLILTPPALLVSMAPVSIAGWGVREAALVYALAFAGVAAVDALAISVLYGIMSIFSGLPGAVLWFMSSRLKLNELKQVAATDTEESIP